MSGELGPGRIFADRTAAGAELARWLAPRRGPDLAVVGIARGGVVVAAEIARRLDAPLDVVAVRKVRHPWQPEYAIGAVAPDGGVYIRGADGLSVAQVEDAVTVAQEAASVLDWRLHAGRTPLALAGRTVAVVDDGLATGATMIAALRFARHARAETVIAAVPVAAAESEDAIRAEADDLVCPHVVSPLFAVGLWYEDFGEVDDRDVILQLDAFERARERTLAPAAFG